MTEHLNFFHIMKIFNLRHKSAVKQVVRLKSFSIDSFYVEMVS